MEQAFTLNPLDIIILAIIGFGMYKGAKNGFLKGATRIMAIVAGVLLGFRFRGIAENLYLDYFNLQASPELVAILSFATAFVIIYIVVSTIMSFLTNSLKKVNIQIDNAVGALLGGVISTLILSVALIILSYVNFPSRENAQGSMLYPPVRNFARYSLGFGLQALQEASRQVNKYGVVPPNAPPADSPGSPPSSEKPKAIR
jgi:membrane protein required for colicin V production